MWKKALAVLFGFLMLGLTVSSASASASFVNGTVNGTVTVPPEFNPEKKPGDEVRPQFGGATVVAEPFISAFVPGIGWIVAVGSIVALIAKYVYSKPVSEFTEAFVGEIPDKITYNGQELAKGVKTNFWGTEVEIGYGYVKKEWGGLKKEAVIVKSVIKINRDEVKAVEDLFSPKEYGKLLAQAYLNGWDAEKAKDIVKEFHDEYKDVFVKNGVTFRGTDTCKIKLPSGEVILDNDRASHIVGRHVFGIYEYDGQADPTVFPKYLTMREIVILIKKTIEEGEVQCGSIKPLGDGTIRVSMEKTFPELRTDRYTSKTLRVVLEYNPKKGCFVNS